MKKNLVKEKSFEFALNVIKISKMLIEQKEFVISKQLLRSGTAVGALVREAEYAESKKDFIHKMAIALKEANETKYWLDLLFYSELLTEQIYKSLEKEIISLLKLLTSIINTSKSNI